VGASGRSLQATTGHNHLPSVQLDGSLSDTGRRTAMLRRCLLGSGSWLRVPRRSHASEVRAAYLAEVVGVVSRPLAEGEGWSAQEFGHGVHA
jgi:hypothetical protein